MYSLIICYMYTLCKDSQHFNISLTHPSPHIFNFVCMREHISSTLLANFHFTLQSIVRVSVLIFWILRTYSFFFWFVFHFYNVLGFAVQKGKSAVVIHTSPASRAALLSPIQLSNPATKHVLRKNHNLKRHVYPDVHCSTIYNGQDMEAT